MRKRQTDTEIIPITKSTKKIHPRRVSQTTVQKATDKMFSSKKVINIEENVN